MHSPQSWKTIFHEGIATDIARQPRRVREAFTRQLKDDLEFLSRLMPGAKRADRYEAAIGAFASMAGALILARAVSDATFSDLILKSTARRALSCAKVPSPRHSRKQGGSKLGS